jgi:ribosomal protein S18 acetylase RimI-like enzyme
MIEFIPMDETDFQEYLARTVQDYADENVKAGAWDREGSLTKSRRAFDQLLPEGRLTEGHELLLITDSEQQATVGIIWYMMSGGPESRGAFICDLHIDEAHRRQGYGRRALLHLEEQLAERGVSRIGLHVFSDNTAARALYESLGYAATGINMVKRVGSGRS